MNQKKALDLLREKINLKEYSRAFANILYKYYITYKGEIANLENVKLFAIGKVVTTNYCLVSEEHPLCWNYDDMNTYHFLVLKNIKNNEPLGILLPPINNENSIECKSFQYAFPIYDAYESGVNNKDALFFQNVFNEQVEVEYEKFDKSINFTDLFNEKQKKLNKLLFEFNKKDSTPLLSTIVFEYIK